MNKITSKISAVFLALMLLMMSTGVFSKNKSTDEQRPRARPRACDVGLVVGTMRTSKYNAIMDVEGVRVGHSTVIQEPDIHTGVTAIIPAPGNL